MDRSSLAPYTNCSEDTAVLEHVFVAYSDTSDMVCTVCFKGILDNVSLPIVRSIVVVWDGVVTKVNCHVNLGLFDGFQLMRCSQSW